MKKLALALAAVAAFAGQAIAADMPARITKAPVAAPLPVASWTGFWVSGGFGYGLYDIDHSTVSTAIPPTIFDVGHDNGGRGWLGKVGVGGDYQFAGPFGSWVIGVFADASWTDIKGNYSYNCPGGCAGPTGFAGQQKLDWSWAVGGRIGYVALPGFLTYFNGGYTEARFGGATLFDASAVTTTAVALPSRTFSGYFLGGGTEYAISQIPGLLTLKGSERPIVWDVRARLDGDTIVGTATTRVKLTDFGLEPPRLAILSVEDEMTWQIDLVAERVP